MATKNYRPISYEEAFANCDMPYNDKAKAMIKALCDDGYSQQGILYALNCESSKIQKFAGDSRQLGIARNAVYKLAFQNKIKANANSNKPVSKPIKPKQSAFVATKDRTKQIYEIMRKVYKERGRENELLKDDIPHRTFLKHDPTLTIYEVTQAVVDLKRRKLME